MSLRGNAAGRAVAVFELAGGVSQPVSEERIAAAKSGFATRRADLRDVDCIIRDVKPKSGDLVLARVEAIGHHTKIETPSGRRAHLYTGDEIIVAYGARYAPDQFEAVIPPDLRPCDLAAAGGLAGRVMYRHAKVRKTTKIVPVGLLGDRNGRAINLKRYAMSPSPDPERRPTAIAVVGTSMNAGKTTAAASLVKGLTAAGLRVGVAKLTGTGSGGDLWSMLDAGADEALDFTDMGYPSTQKLGEKSIREITVGLFNHLSSKEHDILIVEIADGLFQRETSLLLNLEELRARISGILFAAGDAMGAAAGARWLQQRRLPLLGVTGLVTASPLARREAVEAAGVPAFGKDELADPAFAPKLCLGGDRQIGAYLKLCG